MRYDKFISVYCKYKIRMCFVLKSAVQKECMYTGVCCKWWQKASSVQRIVLRVDGVWL